VVAAKVTLAELLAKFFGQKRDNASRVGVTAVPGDPVEAVSSGSFAGEGVSSSVNVNKEITGRRRNLTFGYVVVEGVRHVYVNYIIGRGFGSQPLGHTGRVILEIGLIGVVAVQADDEDDEGDEG
jgi:hypothetical protein